MTNYEKIKKMSVEEMAALIALKIPCEVCPAYAACVDDTPCNDRIKQWLESEVEE